MRTRRSWAEKLHDVKGLPKTGPLEGRMLEKWGPGTLFVPVPTEVDALMKQVPAGKLTTINEIRDALARRHDATITCPITTGIAAWLAANAANEAALEGEDAPTPYWRTLKMGGEINPKYPGGPERVKELLVREGHQVLAKGTRLFVRDFEKKLHAF